MAATIQLKCSACGARHTFFLPIADLFNSNAEYEYTCPKTATKARVTTDNTWGSADAQIRPRGSVVVNQVDN